MDECEPLARGIDVVHLELGGVCSWTDHFVIATAKSPRHIRMVGLHAWDTT